MASNGVNGVHSGHALDLTVLGLNSGTSMVSISYPILIFHCQDHCFLCLEMYRDQG